MKALQGLTRTTFLGFFISHIIFTLLVDIQAILPDPYIPSPCQQLLEFWTSLSYDPLMTNPKEKVWFQSLIVCELLFQIPFFITAVYYLSDSTAVRYPSWFGPICMAYGAHTATTLVPILTTIAVHPDVPSLGHRFGLFNVYLPYLVFPLWILYIATQDHIQTYQSIVYNGSSSAVSTTTSKVTKQS